MAGEPRKRLGELLLDAGVIDAAQLQAALGHQRQWGARLGQALVDLKLVAEADIVQALSRKFGYEVARLDALQPYALQQALRLVPREFAVRNNVLPMTADTGSITVAMSDPTNLSVVDELRFRTGRRIRICVGGDREIAAAVRQHYPSDHALEAIALDLDADDPPGEQVLDPFGGGSKDALEAFFGSGPPTRGASADPVRSAPTDPARPAAAAPRPPPVAARPGSPPPDRRPGPPASPPTSRPPRAGTSSAERPAASPAGVPAQAASPAPPQRPAGTELELEDLHGGPEAIDQARSALLGAIPAGGLAAEEPWHEPGPGAPHVAGQAAPPPRPPAASPPPAAPFTARERAVLDALERLAGGAHAEPEILKPAQAMAAVIRLLIRHGVVSEREFLDELRRR